MAYQTFSIGLKVARATGLTKPLRRAIGPIIGRLVSRVSANHGLPIVVNGHRMVLGANGSYPPIRMATGRYEVETTRLFERLLKPGMVVVDVGAHVGYFSLVAARQVGSTGRVYSFEPEPTNHSLLLQNIELNEYQQVVPVNKALSDRVGSATLIVTALDSGRNSMYPIDMPTKGTLEIETTTADAFLEELGWPEIDLVKIDVEGAEADVLNGMDQLLAKSGKLNLIVEFNPALLRKAGVDLMDFLRMPPSLGFDAFWIDEDKGPQRLEETDLAQLVERLLESEGSINLHYAKHGAKHNPNQ